MVVRLQPAKPEEILSELGFATPMDAARQQAKMILLGRIARYEAEMQRMAVRTQSSLAALQARYEELGAEDADADDHYLQWLWLTEAVAATRAQLVVLEAE